MTVKKEAQEFSNIHSVVREYYADAIKPKSKESSSDCGCSAGNDTGPQSGSCCGDKQQTNSCCGGNDTTGSCCGETRSIYEDPNVHELPADVTDISFGCGDPVTLASLNPGQTVLDLGSGGGIDCFLAAKQVGPTGYVIGVDMTPAMIDRARSNQAKVGVDNVEFRLGEIEHLPVEDGSVDVAISNCVINLSPDKPQVFRELYRVLKPGGRIAVSDIVTQGELPEGIKKSLAAWAGCVAGAVDVSDYQEAIAEAGFMNIKIVPVYLAEEMVDEAIQQIDPSVLASLDRDAARRSIFSAKITASKP